ncbi:MAG: diguanylate cyclase [Phycisphaerae bacterium]|nr:diguanylate cyclase [Phycisphaerae bacterium]
MSDLNAQPVVLVIDDSVDVHRLIGARLKSENVTIASAMDGRQGLAMAAAQRPAVVLLDLDMPGMDGYAVLRGLKNDPCTVNVPVIVLSGMSDSSDKVQAFELGATDYVTKPFDFAELRARVKAALRLDHLLRLLADRAEIDGLTGLNNRASFNKRWAAEINEHRRYGHPVSLAMLDIDHFKKINDTFGHPAGDAVLQDFARIVQACVRSTDVPCRYGGEEFAVIMPHTAAGDALAVCERIREALAAHVFRRHPEHRVTASIGLTGSQGSIVNLPPERWIEEADQALYRAKHSGRNRVVAAPFPNTPDGAAPSPSAAAA